MANQSLIQGTIDIDASPATVWGIISDLKRMGEWSPQCRKMVVIGGAVKKGTRTFNINKAGNVHWPTNAKVVEFEPEKKIAFRIFENRTIWSYELEPTETGTRVTESRRAPDGVSALPDFAIRYGMGGTDRFESALSKGIDKTLSRIKAEAERV